MPEYHEIQNQKEKVRKKIKRKKLDDLKNEKSKGKKGGKK